VQAPNPRLSFAGSAENEVQLSYRQAVSDSIPLGRVQRKQMDDHISCLAVRADPTSAPSAQAAGKIVQCLTVTPSPEGFVLSQRAGVSL
jgi:hypothetical protein